MQTQELMVMIFSIEALGSRLALRRLQGFIFRKDFIPVPDFLILILSDWFPYSHRYGVELSIFNDRDRKGGGGE